MKALWSMLLGLLVVGVMAVSVRAADEGKEVTLKGKITCAKCDLKQAKACHTVIVVPKNGKDVVYYLDKNSPGYTHKEICQEAKEGSVTGTVHKQGGKNYIKATKVSFD